MHNIIIIKAQSQFLFLKDKVKERYRMKKWELKSNGPGRDRTNNLLHTGQLRYYLRHWDDDFLQTQTDTNRSQFFNFPKSPPSTIFTQADNINLSIEANAWRFYMFNMWI